MKVPTPGQNLWTSEDVPPHGSSAPPSFVKPLPPELFAVHGPCAEMRWEAVHGLGRIIPNDRFFVRNHTRTPSLDAATWRLRLHGSGLRSPHVLTYADLRALPATTVECAIECAGNGRDFFGSQQGRPVPGTPWRLGGIGVARWRGVPLPVLLDRAGITADAVDVLPTGLDPAYVDHGVDHGRVRRPIPVAKALDDVLVAYEMNGEPLPPDHGFPARLVVPGWVGIASIKWVGDIEVSTSPLPSPWSTDSYRLFGPGHPDEGGAPLTAQVVKSAFELPWPATLQAGRTHLLRGRSWSGGGRIARVEVSDDRGATWRPARVRDTSPAWTLWEHAWSPSAIGPYALIARAVDATGTGQPLRAAYNTMGYLFDGLVEHPVTVVP